jgi:hypothetical protein
LKEEVVKKEKVVVEFEDSVELGIAPVLENVDQNFEWEGEVEGGSELDEGTEVVFVQ